MADLFVTREKAEDDLMSAAAFIAERIRSADGHAEAMNTVIPQYLAKGNVDLAAELANAVDDPYSRDRLLMQVAEKCAVLDDDEYALQLADAIDDNGMQAQCRERVAIVVANKGDMARAAAIAEELQHPEFVFASIAVALNANGREAEAEETISEIDFPTARVSAWQHIASARIEKKDLEKAADALSEAADAAKEIEHNEERIRSLIEIGNLYIEVKRSDKAVEVFDTARADAEVLENIHRDFFLGSCALGFLHAGSDELADGTLDLVMDKTQMASALLGFARDHWKKEEKDDALDALDEAYQILKSQKDIETRDSRGANALMTSIAAQFAGFGKTERAIEIAHENFDPAEVTAGLTQIAQILAMQKEDELARQTINQIAEDADRVFALVQFADTKFAAGDNDAAIASLDEAMQLVDTVPQMVSRANILIGLATRFSDAGEKDRAVQAAHACLAVIAEVRDEAAQATELAELGLLYSEAGFEIGDVERRIVEPLLRKADQ
jgi:tetratricopeptide (TPR) repeat protein